MKIPSVGTAFETVRQASISLVAMLGALFAVYTFADAITGDLVVMDPLRVPPSFEARGYTSDITTQRLLDEIARLNSLSSIAKERKNYGDAALFDNIAQSDATIAGLDVKMIRAAIQKAIGREPTRISGEVALTTIDGKDAFAVRLRSNPPRRLLVDIAVDGEPIQVLEKTAMALLEQLDPVIAMSVYRVWNDWPNALRMADAALTNDDPSDDKVAIQQRSFVYAALHRFPEAKADAETATGFPRHAALSNLYREMGNNDEALTEADAAVKDAPKNPQGYLQQARTLLQMNKTDEALVVLRKSMETFPSYWPFHYWLGVALARTNNVEGAKLAFGRTLAIAPKQVSAHFAMANVEAKTGNKSAALAEYRQAHALDPRSPLYLIALFEAESGSGNRAGVDKLRKDVESASADEQTPTELRQRAKAALAAAPAN